MCSNLHSELFKCFFFLFSWLDGAWINSNKSKRVINWYNFPSVLQKVSFKIVLSLPVHHTMKTSRVVHLMPLSYQTSVLGLLALQCYSCYFFVQGCFSKMFFFSVAIILPTAYLHHSCGCNIYLGKRFDSPVLLLYAIILCHNLIIILCGFWQWFKHE